MKKKLKKALALGLAGVVTAGCFGGYAVPVAADEKKDEIVELTWYVAGQGPQADTAAVLEEANKYLEEKIGCHLNIIATDYGNYDQKMQMLITGQEEFDLCFTSNWTNNYYNNISKNAFLEMDELLPKYAPELYEMIPDEAWEAVTVNDKIWAIPNQQIWVYMNGFIAEKEYVDKYNFDMSSAKQLKDLEPLLQAIKDDNPDMYPFAMDQTGILGFQSTCLGYEELIGSKLPGAVELDSESGEIKVVNQYELPQVKELFTLMHDWNQKGLIRPDAATVTEVSPDLLAGKLPVGVEGTIKPGVDAISTVRHGGRTVVSSAFTDAWMTTGSITGTLTAISRTSKHPEKAMEFLNLVNTDEYLYNLITIGIEGKHYEKTEDGFVKVIENSGYSPNTDWMYGNNFLAYFKEGQEKTDWEKTKEINDNAKTSPILGFSFDSTPVQNEIASVSAVLNEYILSLESGAVDPEKVMPEFLEKMKVAGSDKLIEEAQSQLDKWLASK